MYVDPSTAPSPPPPNVNQRYHISLKSIYSNSVWILYNLIVQMHFSIQE